MHQKSLRLAAWIYAPLFGSVATYHFFTLLDSEMPHAMVMRHLIFCIVDAAFAGMTWFWPRWLLIPVGILTVQQFFAHTRNVWHAWHHGQFDPLGTLTLFGLVTLVIVLIQDEFKRHRSLKPVKHEERAAH